MCPPDRVQRARPRRAAQTGARPSQGLASRYARVQAAQLGRVAEGHMRRPAPLETRVRIPSRPWKGGNRVGLPG